MNHLADEKLLRLQNAELKILCELRDYCKKKSLTYYLAFGTLLGAVRHQGFIPWDDDIDVFMPREDYQRFLVEAENDLPDWLSIRTYKNSKLGENNFAVQAKVEAKSIYVVRSLGKNNVKHRIWVDVFILDGMPKTSIVRDIHYYSIQALFWKCWIAKTKIGTKKELPRPLYKKIGLAIIERMHINNYIDLIETYDEMTRTFMKYDYERSDYVIGYAHAYGHNCIVPRWCFGQGQPILFEGEIFNAPADPDTLLKSWYGDYMTLPPEEQRIAKHCVDIIMDDSDETSVQVQTAEKHF